MKQSRTLPSRGRAWRAAVVLAAGLACAGTVAAQVRALINPGDQGEQSRYSVYQDLKAVLEKALLKEKLVASQTAISTDATADLSSTRARLHDVLVAPAHVIGSAVRHGYTPLLGLDQPVQAVLVTSKASPIASLADARGSRLGLPLQDSVVTYLVRGEVVAANSSIRQHFASVYETRYQDALLVCLQLRRCDVVAVERAVFARWVAAGEPVKEILQSKPVPGLSVAVKDGSGADATRLRAALAETLRTTATRAAVGLAAGDFEYVSTLGYFTPRSLPGGTVVDATTVAGLLPRAHFIDTRNETEYKAGHVPGARLVPYHEKSAKDPDYDPKVDSFDLARLPAERDAPLIFACNGPECWKSFKAARAAIAAGYTHVHWFRGGFPEWRKSGKQVAAAI